jgi:hypothetical protein
VALYSAACLPSQATRSQDSRQSDTPGCAGVHFVRPSDAGRQETGPGNRHKGKHGWLIIGNWEAQEEEIENWEFEGDLVRGLNTGTLLWQQHLPSKGRIRFEARLVAVLGSDEIDVVVGDSMVLYYSAGVRLDYMTDDLTRDRNKKLVTWPKPRIGQWYAFSIVKTNGKCELLIDGKRVMDIPYDVRRTRFRGRIGFAHWHNRVEFRNLRIEDLP